MMVELMKKILIIGPKIDNPTKSLTGPERVFENITKNITSSMVVVSYRQLFCIIKYILLNRVSTVHIFGFTRVNVMALVLAKIMQKKVFYTMNGLVSRESIFFKGKYNRFHYLIEKILITRANKIICVSTGLKKMVTEDYVINEAKIQVIPNGVDDLFLEEKNEEILNSQLGFKNNDNKKIIFTASGTARYKGISPLVKVISEIERDDFIFVIAGPKGNAHEDIVGLIDNKKIYYVGNLNQKELINTYYNSYVYIQNSFYETFGLAPLEAMAVGTPIIVSENVQMSYLLEGSELKKFIVKDEEELKEKIIFLLDNPDVSIKLKDEAKKIAVNNTWDNVRSQYEELWSIF